MVKNYILPNYLRKYVPKRFRDYIKAMNPLDDSSLTITETAVELGLESRYFDTALPQGFVDDFILLLGETPVRHFVWKYPESIQKVSHNR